MHNEREQCSLSLSRYIHRRVTALSHPFVEKSCFSLHRNDGCFSDEGPPQGGDKEAEGLG